MPSPLRISSATDAEAARLQEQIAALKLQINGGDIPSNGPLRRVTRKLRVQIQSDQLSKLEARLADLTSPGGTPNTITPSPDSGPVFSGPRLDTGRVGVDALKLISNIG